MSDIEDLEAYEYEPPTIDNAQGGRARKMANKNRRAISERASIVATRQHWLNGQNRRQPSLPRLKFLEKTD